MCHTHMDGMLGAYALAYDIHMTVKVAHHGQIYRWDEFIICALNAVGCPSSHIRPSIPHVEDTHVLLGHLNLCMYPNTVLGRWMVAQTSDVA